MGGGGKNVTWKNKRSKYTLKLVIPKYLHENYLIVITRLLLTVERNKNIKELEDSESKLVYKLILMVFKLVEKMQSYTIDMLNVHNEGGGVDKIVFHIMSQTKITHC